MKSIGFEKVTLRRGHIAEKEKLARRATIPTVYKQFCDSGRVGAFKCDWKEGKEPKPHYFWDSDVAKWIEGAKEYYLQQFKDSGDVLNLGGLSAFDEEEMKKLKLAAEEFVPGVQLRGV